MKYIKTFESEQQKPYWYIDGDYKTVCETVKKYLTYQQYKLFLKATWSWWGGYAAHIEKHNKVNGALICQFGQDDYDFSLWILTPDRPLSIAQVYYNTHNYIFQGELRIEDNKLIKDRLMRDAQKYNL
jgi:hypothetical protein